MGGAGLRWAKDAPRPFARPPRGTLLPRAIAGGSGPWGGRASLEALAQPRPRRKPELRGKASGSAGYASPPRAALLRARARVPAWVSAPAKLKPTERAGGGVPGRPAAHPARLRPAPRMRSVPPLKGQRHPRRGLRPLQPFFTPKSSPGRRWACAPSYPPLWELRS